MKVTSTTTLVTGSQLEPVYHKPGTPVDLPKAEAEDLIARGIAAPYAPRPLPEFSQEEREHPGTGESMEPVDDVVLDFLNNGTVTDLRNIKGVGKKTADDIIASREADGPFASLEDAASRVGGVSLEQLQAAGITA